MRSISIVGSPSIVQILSREEEIMTSTLEEGSEEASNKGY